MPISTARCHFVPSMMGWALLGSILRAATALLYWLAKREGPQSPKGKRRRAGSRNPHAASERIRICRSAGTPISAVDLPGVTGLSYDRARAATS